MPPKRLKDLSNNDLWRRWSNALEAWAQDPNDRYLRFKMDQAENEIVRRIHGAAKQPLVRQEA
jgi:hypothetical protein